MKKEIVVCVNCNTLRIDEIVKTKKKYLVSKHVCPVCGCPFVRKLELIPC